MQLLPVGYNINKDEYLRSALKSIYNPKLTLLEIEKLYIETALMFFKGNRTQTASALGINYKTLMYKMRNHNIEVVK